MIKRKYVGVFTLCRGNDLCGGGLDPVSPALRAHHQAFLRSDIVAEQHDVDAGLCRARGHLRLDITHPVQACRSHFLIDQHIRKEIVQPAQIPCPFKNLHCVERHRISPLVQRLYLPPDRLPAVIRQHIRQRKGVYLLRRGEILHGMEELRKMRGAARPVPDAPLVHEPIFRKIFEIWTVVVGEFGRRQGHIPYWKVVIFRIVRLPCAALELFIKRGAQFKDKRNKCRVIPLDYTPQVLSVRHSNRSFMLATNCSAVVSPWNRAFACG